MKKLLMLFIFAQMFLLSVIFHQSLYDIIELNNVGDSKLEGYALQDYSGDDLNTLYDEIMEVCSSLNCNLQLIKTPVTQDQTFLYEIFHSDIEQLNKVPSIRSDRTFHYYLLTKEEFIDNNGVFYTDLAEAQVEEIADNLGLKISSYHQHVNYSQIIWQNSLNLGLLVLLTVVVFFIFTFTRIKVNAVKKMLGFSNIKMIYETLRNILFMELAIALIIIVIHHIYFAFFSESGIVNRYFLYLIIFMISVIIVNLLLFLLTQLHVRFIDIQLMIKNKVFSNRLNYILYFTKIILIMAITVSISYCVDAYQSYNASQQALEKHTQLSGYFTSNGFNSNQYDQIMNDVDLVEEYSGRILDMYEYFDAKDQMYINDAAVLDFLSANYLKIQGLEKEDIYNSQTDNYIVANQRYIKDFLPIKNIEGNVLNNLQSDRPLIIVPEKYQSEEQNIRDIYQEKIADYYNYHTFYGVRDSKEITIDEIDILYSANNQEFDIMGQFNLDNEEELKLIDPIIIVDQGKFSGLYYLDLLNASNMYFKLEERETFHNVLVNHQLDSLINVATLLTPLNDQIHFVQFILYNTFLFSILFLATLIFVIVISNYVDIVSNRRKYTMQYIYGFSMWKVFKGQTVVYSILLFGNLFSLLISFNPFIYTTLLIIDFIVLIIIYQYEIKKDLHQVVKGG
ncbi:hypothetical protein GGQ92_003034 [Gracilibacillus halotolerans]|uniref:Bacteriocin-associated integral membrane (Putative immunity) protein n=1 Tax=Gracilibacillus halotolerans TaxID=74386 RepID=A0A841RQV9_9BACI|nr:hypothetical protein [Gracilibacillus halotolerans]MBB6514212.1 hypothetical protein [Gracilibacillus halotolerans]